MKKVDFLPVSKEDMDKRGGYAVMVVETDQTIPEDSIKWLEHLEGVIKVTYLDITGGGKNVL